MIDKSRVLAVLLVLVILFFSCKEKLTSETPLEDISHDSSYELINPEDPARLAVFDNNTVFIGEFDDVKLVVKIIQSSQAALMGFCYILEDTSLYLDPIPFSIETQGDYYCCRYGENVFYFDMKYQRNSQKLNGVVLGVPYKQDKQAARNARFQYFDFEKYLYSNVNNLHSDRYQRPVFEVAREKDVKYGRAKGYWTSIPVPSGESCAQAISKYLLGRAANSLGNFFGRNSDESFKLSDLDLTMDIYTPKNDSLKNRPLVVLIHGGAFFFGDKNDDEMVAQCTHLASLGYVAVSINYRMGFKADKASIQQCAFRAMQDAHAAMRYLCHNANTSSCYIDKDYIYVGGSSAGAITAMSVAYLTDKTRPESTKGMGSMYTSGNAFTDKVKIRGLVNMWGALFETSGILSNPLPIVSFHGTEDKVVPYCCDYPFSHLNGSRIQVSKMLFDKMYGSDEIHKILRNKTIHQQFYSLKGEGHAPWKSDNQQLNEHYDFIQQKMSDFLYEDLIYGIKLVKTGNTSYRVAVNNGNASNVKAVNWQLEGGVVLSQTNNTVDIRLFRDEPSHKLSAMGLLKNDAEFTTTTINF